MTKLRIAAQDVLTRWDSPNWKDTIDTSQFMEAMRSALAEPPHPNLMVSYGYVGKVTQHFAPDGGYYAEFDPPVGANPDDALCTSKPLTFGESSPIDEMQTLTNSEYEVGSQKPVAWAWERKWALHEFGYEPFEDFCPKNATSIIPLYTTPPSIDALIAEIDDLPTLDMGNCIEIPLHHWEDFIENLDKYRSKP